VRLVQDAESAKQSGSSNVTNCWAPHHFEQDPSSPFELFVGRQPASDPIVLEVGQLSGHRGANGAVIEPINYTKLNKKITR
jgi:hypothetical protein